jgi:predicted transcriptional regulator
MRLDDDNASFRFNQQGLRKFLGDLETEIMELVWQKANPTVTVRDIFDELKQHRQIAYTTVMTTMVRLSEKGILRVVGKAGLANSYAPDKTRDEFVRSIVSKILGIFLRQFPQECKSYLKNSQQSRPGKRRKPKGQRSS